MKELADEVRLRRNLMSCLDHVKGYLLDCQPREQQIDGLFEDRYPLVTYARVCNMFRSMQLLLNNGVNDDAMTIARPMIEEALRLHHLANVSNHERKCCIAYYARRGIMEIEAITKIGASWWPIAQDGLALAERLRSELDQWTQAERIKAKKVDETTLVRRYLPADLQLVWRSCQQMVHGSLFAHLHLLPDEASNPVTIWADSSIEQLRETAAFACFALATAHNAMADTYDWPRMPEAEALGLTVLHLTEVDG